MEIVDPMDESLVFATGTIAMPNMIQARNCWIIYKHNMRIHKPDRLCANGQDVKFMDGNHVHADGWKDMYSHTAEQNHLNAL